MAQYEPAEMATSETEVRRRHRDEGAEENEDAEPDVSPEDSEPAPEGTDYWDLDDDDQWGSSSYSSSELAKKRKVLRRSNLEVGIAFVCHLTLMCYYIYVHVYDATIVKRNKGEGFDFSYGGRWKFLTYINIVRAMQHNLVITHSTAVPTLQSIFHTFILFIAVVAVCVLFSVFLHRHHAS